MGKISKILYEEVSPEVSTIDDSSLFYFYQNALGLDEALDAEYEEYEMRQMHMRMQVLNNAARIENLPKLPNTNSVVYGVSSIADKVILIAEL